MKEYWPLEASEENRIYTFLSCGPKGNIDMTIQFTPTEENGIFNLAFGILNRDGKMDDVIINNNGTGTKLSQQSLQLLMSSPIITRVSLSTS